MTSFTHKHFSMIRAAYLVLIISLGILFLLVHSSKAMAIGLKENSVVSDNTIKLGDIFYGLKENTDKVLGPAPRPGSEMVLNARTLMRIAIALDLPWRPSSTADYVVLTRSATVLSNSLVEDQLTDALREKGVQGNFNLTLDSSYREIILPEDQPATLDIEDLTIDPRRSRFEATMLAPSRDNPIYRSKIRGRFEKLIKIPVLRRAIRSGTMIGKRDLDFIDIRARDLTSDMVISAVELLGMTPRRMAKAGIPLKINEIETPQIVARGELITMVFQNGPLILTARGKALENGAKGDLIRVVNTNSNRTVEAIVTGEREVTVEPN